MDKGKDKETSTPTATKQDATAILVIGMAGPSSFLPSFYPWLHDSEDE